MKKKLVCLLLSLLMLATMLPVVALADTPTQEPPAAADPVAEPEADPKNDPADEPQGDPAPAADPIQVTVGEEPKQEEEQQVEEQQVEDQQNVDQKDDQEGVPSVGSSDDLDKEEQEKEQEEEQQDGRLQEEVKEEEPEEQKEEGKEEEPEEQKEEADALQEEEKEEPHKDDGEEQDGESAAPVEYSMAFRVNGETVLVTVPAGERIGESMPAEPVLGDAYIFEGWFDENGNWVDAWTEVNGPMTVTARFMYLPAGSGSASAGGITVTAAWNAGVFPEGTQLTIDPRGRDKALAMAENALPEGCEAVDGEAVDITFIADGISVQPYYGSVSVSISLNRTLEGDSFRVLHEGAARRMMMKAAKAGGGSNIETVSASASATGAAFSGSGFSIYAIVGSTEHPSLIQARRTYQFYAGEPTADRSGWPKVFEAIYTDGDTLEVPEAPGGDSKHRFSGWYVYENGAYTTTQVMAGPVDLSGLTEDDTVQVYAKFDQQYKVTLYTDETMTAVFDTILALDGETVTLPSPAEAQAAGLIILPHKTMNGWKYPGDTGASVTNDEVTISGQDIDLVPEFSSVHNVKFELVKEAFQSSPISDQLVPNGEKVVEPDYVIGNTYAHDGKYYKFEGWYLHTNYQPGINGNPDEFINNPFDFETPLQPTDPDDITFYAKWTFIKTLFTVTPYRERQNNAVTSGAYPYEEISKDAVEFEWLPNATFPKTQILNTFRNGKYHDTAQNSVGVCHWSGKGLLDDDPVNGVLVDGRVLPVLQVYDTKGNLMVEFDYNGNIVGGDVQFGNKLSDWERIDSVRVNYNRNRYKLSIRLDTAIAKPGTDGRQLNDLGKQIAEECGVDKDIEFPEDMVVKYAQHLYKVTHEVYDYGAIYDQFMQEPWVYTRNSSDFKTSGQAVFDATNKTFPVVPVSGKIDTEGVILHITLSYKQYFKKYTYIQVHYDNVSSWSEVTDEMKREAMSAGTGKAIVYASDGTATVNGVTYAVGHGHNFDLGKIDGAYRTVAVTGQGSYRLDGVYYADGSDAVWSGSGVQSVAVWATNGYYGAKGGVPDDPDDPTSFASPIYIHHIPATYTVTFKQTNSPGMVNGYPINDDTIEADVVVPDVFCGTNVSQIIQDYAPDWTTLKDDQGRIYTAKDGWFGDMEDGSFPETMPGRDIVLYRKWETDTFTVTFDLNGHTVDGEQIHHHYDVPKGENIVEFPELAAYTAREDWIFLRWAAFERNADGTKGAPIDGYTPNTPIDRDYYLVAQWAREVPYTVEYRPGDHGQFSADLAALLISGKDPKTYTAGNDASVKGVAEGSVGDGVQYVFTGWKIGGSGALVAGGDTFEISDDNDKADGGAADQNIVLVAQYEPLTPPKASITYHANYPTKAEPAPQTIRDVTVMNGTYTIDKNAESYSWHETGYRFVCWTNSPEEAARIFDSSPSRVYEYFYEGEVIALGQGNDNDLYAVWEPFDEPTITVTVKKVWDDEDDTNRKRSGVEAKFVLQKTVNGVSVQVDAVTVEKTQHWTYTWSALPAFEGNQQVTYSVKEDLIVANGYQSDTVAWKTVSDGQTITITNKYRVKDDTPPTGDTTKTVLWASLMLVSAFGCVGALLLAPRKRRIWR